MARSIIPLLLAVLVVCCGPELVGAASLEVLDGEAPLGDTWSPGMLPEPPDLLTDDDLQTSAARAKPALDKIRGIHYAPHQVGEPSNNVISTVIDVYQSVYRDQHYKHLDLIAKHIGANTLHVQPWDNRATDSVLTDQELSRRPFFQAMQSSKIENLIPTFQVSKHYYDAIMEGQVIDHGPDSPIFRDFEAFLSSIVDFDNTFDKKTTNRPTFRAWSLDLAPDIKDLWDGIPPSGQVDDCSTVEPPALVGTSASPFQRYKEVLTALGDRVWPSTHVPDWIKDKPLLVPLDLTEYTGDQWPRTQALLKCLTQWFDNSFRDLFKSGKASWLLTFTLPMPNLADDVEKDLVDCSKDKSRCKEFVSRGFVNYLDDLIGPTFEDAEVVPNIVVMLGAHALAYNTHMAQGGIVEDFGTAEADGKKYLPRQQLMLRYAFEQYKSKEEKAKHLQGFIIDEWMDNWDRGSSSLFVKADIKLQGVCGSRFKQDRGPECRREVGLLDDGTTYYAYPESVGLAATVSKVIFHCAKPRFAKTGIPLLADTKDATHLEGDVASMVCAVMIPSTVWSTLFGVILVIAVGLQCASCIFQTTRVQEPTPRPPPEPREARPPLSADVNIKPSDRGLEGDFKIRISSTMFADTDQAEEWLKCHYATQIEILDKQLSAELLAVKACRERAEAVRERGAGQELPSELDSAVRTIHRRCFEGYDAWCRHLSIRRQDPLRPIQQLFAECVLQRTVESLSEHVIHCPERISYLMYGILKEAERGAPQSNDVERPAASTGAVPARTYKVDLDMLQDGLARMMQNSNPYKPSDVGSLLPGAGPNHKYQELGLNFDDINESGMQRPDVAGHSPLVRKMFKEPRSVFVVIDLVLSYRVMLVIKFWVLVLGFYLYLGSGLGRDVTTKYNGAFFAPQYLRVDIWFYAGLVDAVLWIVLELLVVGYGGLQRLPAWRSSVPGAPNVAWLVQHALCLVLSMVGFYVIYNNIRQDTKAGNLRFGQRSEKCLTSCSGDCMDSRVGKGGHYDYGLLSQVMVVPVVYWLHRFVIFYLLHRRRWPTLIYGKPSAKLAKTRDDRALAIWVVMLALCMYFEGYLLLPVTAGLDWMNQCGLSLLNPLTNLPGLNKQVGVCTNEWITSSCVPCALSVLCVWLLVTLSCYLDIYFIFYVFSAIVGGVEGNRRKLNNLKNPSVVIDLRSAEGGKGQELELMENAFGPRWRILWRCIVKDLWDDSLIGLSEAKALLEAAGVPCTGAEDLHNDRCEVQVIAQGRELDLGGELRGCDLAAERLCFFFKSLSTITKKERPNFDDFRPKWDGLTAENLHVGSIPPVTMIIPAYNETVVPTRHSLCEGARLDDARNQLSGIGAGERTLPPKGDGMNTNLAFLISQFPDEWAFLAERVHKDANVLYDSFVGHTLHEEERREVCKWAALRTQTVAKTIWGSLKYLRALASLPAIQDHYRQHHPGKRVPEMHAELILAHQTFGSKRGQKENDDAVKALLKENSDLPFYLVFDMNEQTNDETKELVRKFLASRFPRHRDATLLKYARVKCCWNEDAKEMEVMEVLPRRFPLRVGHTDDFKSQGKASNQLNALLFASGHNFQALDCNMGTCIAECYKVPFVLRDFLPADAQWEPNRTSVQCRYIGFREYIFTGREGCIGQRHAAAEWTFGTIYQRFLSVLEIRMHYGHPDFIDGFWARNRGGMSKGSPVVNLSEDIFAGYNVRMREEKSPHTDVLEYEKGREATLNAASGFFAKIAAGSISVLRSRDNHLLCERIGILHGMSFYFASIGFYLSNLLVDLTTYLYVLMFICFTLASISLGDLKQLDSALGTEWILSMGLISMVPQLVEMVIEFGAPAAVGKILSGFISATFFFIFQNKNVAAAMKQGIITGSARYVFTGRPTANQHQTWKDVYTMYWKSHYHPGLDLLVLYLIYGLLVVQSEEGQLPMSLVVASFVTWLCGPMLFSPFPKWRLIKQDMDDFSKFINSKAGMEAKATEEVLVRANNHKCRSLYELGLADEIAKWTERPLKINFCFILSRILMMGLLLTALPAGILDFVLPFVAGLGVQWLFILCFFRGQNNNIFMMLSILVWPLVPVMGHLLIGDRARFEDWRTRLPEYFISALVHFTGLGLVKRICIFVAACWKQIRVSFYGVSEKEAERRLKLNIRALYFYFFDHQTRIFRAYIIMVINLVVSVVLMLLDSSCCLGFGLHSWFLLNGWAAQAQPNRGFMEGETRPAWLSVRARVGTETELSFMRKKERDPSAPASAYGGVFVAGSGGRAPRDQ